MQETQVQSPGFEGPLKKEMTTHSSILAWRIPQTEEPGGLQSMGSQRAGHDRVTKQSQYLRSQMTLRTSCQRARHCSPGQTMTAARKLKDACSLEGKLWPT